MNQKTARKIYASSLSGDFSSGFLRIRREAPQIRYIAHRSAMQRWVQHLRYL